MNKTVITFWKSLFIIVFLCLYFNTAIFAANSEVKLKNIITQITQVKTDIGKKEKQRVSVQQQLQQLEKQMKTVGSIYSSTIQKLKKQKVVLAELNVDQTRYRAKLGTVQQNFFEQIISAYKIERHDYFKALFRPDVLLNSQRLLMYHNSIFAARIGQMDDIKQVLQRLEQNSQQIKKQTKVLERLEAQQRKQKAELARIKQKHDQILVTLKNKIELQNKRLKDLLIAKKNLEKLIAKLTVQKRIMVSSKLKPQLCQKFIWPLGGRVEIHFGSPIEQSSWQWNGIVIAGAENQKVRAVSNGKVIYAGWFNGYGLLLVIDHGYGYMSLYGYNKSLYKKPNDEVIAGEYIAAIGKNSGWDKPGLYFSIRYNGKPVDPEKWCK